jgi:hypothetical protein
MQEPMNMLKSTLEHLAKHAGAKERYLVILAMEVKETGHEEKAHHLQGEYGFRCGSLLTLGIIVFY